MAPAPPPMDDICQLANRQYSIEKGDGFSEWVLAFDEHELDLELMCRAVFVILGDNFSGRLFLEGAPEGRYF